MPTTATGREGDISQFRIKNSEFSPSLPAVLPQPIALLTSRTPEMMRPAVAMAVFPSLGAHLYQTEFVYPDHNYDSALRHFREEMHLTRGTCGKP